MPIEPDAKDWTWVLERRCPQCGEDAQRIRPEQVADLVRDCVAQWQRVLASPTVRERPSPDVWSPLEYGCHVRDVFGVFGERLRLMLEEDDPQFANWDQDATARDQRYDTADPTAVSEELRQAGEAVAGRFATVSGEQWQRPGRRSNGSVFTVTTLARYMLHDVVHHLHDVRFPLRSSGA